MEFLKKLFLKLEPPKEKKYLHTTWDALFTFAFAPAHTTDGVHSTHIKDGMDIKRTMFHVVIALQLCLLFGCWNIGYQHYAAYGDTTIWDIGIILRDFVFGLLQLLPIIIVVHVVGLGIEFIFAAIKGHSVEEGFLVTGMLIPLIVPPDIPLWMVALATAFAVVIAKEAFGGTGMNFLNIALTARVFLFFAYPTFMSGDQVWIAMDTNFLHDIFGLGADVQQYGYWIADAIPNPELAAKAVWTGATPLGLAANGAGDLHLDGLAAITHYYSFWDIFVGVIPGSVGETSVIAVLFGALFLLITRIASWRVMVSMVAGALFMGLLFNMLDLNPFLAVPWYYQLCMGSFFFAMAFMATDPVTAAQTNNGKIVYGFLIGVVGMIVRVLNPAYPEGWMLAILFMNVFAPLIDHVIIQSNIKRRVARG